jgi:hypothetical protein
MGAETMANVHTGVVLRAMAETSCGELIIIDSPMSHVRCSTAVMQGKRKMQEVTRGSAVKQETAGLS